MISLKYPVPQEMTPPVDAGSTLFSLLPQGGPTMAAQDARALRQLREALRVRLMPPVSVTCHPHRVAQRCSVALHFEALCGGSIDLLVTVSGRTSLPEEEDYSRPRWYVTVPDAADLVYLVLYLKDCLTCLVGSSEKQNQKPSFIHCDY